VLLIDAMPLLVNEIEKKYCVVESGFVAMYVLIGAVGAASAVVAETEIDVDVTTKLAGVDGVPDPPPPPQADRSAAAEHAAVTAKRRRHFLDIPISTRSSINVFAKQQRRYINSAFDCLRTN